MVVVSVGAEVEIFLIAESNITESFFAIHNCMEEAHDVSEVAAVFVLLLQTLVRVHARIAKGSQLLRQIVVVELQ